MSTPAAFAALRKREAAADAARKERGEQRAKIDAGHVSAFKKRLRAALIPYNNADLDGLKFTVTEVDGRFHVYVDGNHFLEFYHEIRYRTRCGCSSDDYCDHESSFWYITFHTLQHRKTKGDLLCYFPCDAEGLHNPDKFAYAMSEMVKEYWWSGWPELDKNGWPKKRK